MNDLAVEFFSAAKRRLVMAALLAASWPCTAIARGVTFDARSSQSGIWSDPSTWLDGRMPRSGDRVQVRAGHRVVYDAVNGGPYRMVHVAGSLIVTRERSTSLAVGLLRIEAGDSADEDGFDCDAHAGAGAAGAAAAGDGSAGMAGGAAFEVGTPDDPIPAGVTATLRLVPFDGMNPQTLPAIVCCAGRWDVHGAPMRRTWVKLAATAEPGSRRVELGEAVEGWRAGDRLIVTGSSYEPSGSFRAKPGRAGPGETEERTIASIDGMELLLDRPLDHRHLGTGDTRCEVANLTRNVVIESAEPEGARGHTMYHFGSSGSISYAEFRHLGKEGVLGKYPIHFHKVRDSMRGSSVVGASVWESRNRWITVHGTDYLLVRDCIGYRSVGHGFFLEDATEEYNVLDRNLAVQACAGRRLPEQVLPFDVNDGAGFWWANGRNTFTRNASCENDEYGYRFEIARRSDFDPTLRVRFPNGEQLPSDVRKIPFFRFEDNESHSEGLYSFNFGDDVHPSVSGDTRHPFVARRLRAWRTHYAVRPNVQYFLLDGLTVEEAAYGVYHPDYDAHVYRNILLRRVNAEPINRGHDDESIQYGSFTYENLTFEACRPGRDPLIQLACTSPVAGQSGHFRNVRLVSSESRAAGVVDLGGGPRNEKLENPVVYYFHDLPGEGQTRIVASARFSSVRDDQHYAAVKGFTGRDVRAATVTGVEFPRLLDPVDDLAPATIITSVRRTGGRLVVHGVSHDNGDVASVTVNGVSASLLPAGSGIADWKADIEAPADGMLTARAVDRAGNDEQSPHRAPLSSFERPVRRQRI